MIIFDEIFYHVLYFVFHQADAHASRPSGHARVFHRTANRNIYL